MRGRDFDLIVKDGIVVDGTRAQRYRADLGIRAGRIVAIGRLRASDAQRVLDASGLIVAPGFVDLHTHYDAQLFWDTYSFVLVNREVTIEDDRETGTHSGRLLRHGATGA